jgi:hypothetical protein
MPSLLMAFVVCAGNPVAKVALSCYATTLLHSNAIRAFLGTVLISAMRLILGVLAGVLLAYARCTFLMALLAFAFVFRFRAIIAFAAGVALFFTAHDCWFYNLNKKRVLI